MTSNHDATCDYGQSRAFEQSGIHTIPWVDGETDARKILATSWERSTRTLKKVRDLLKNQVPDVIAAVAVSGSLGRMEQVTQSDLDVIIIVHDDASEPASLAAWERIWDIIDTLNLPRPKTGGIYSRPTSRRELCNENDLGVVDQDIGVFGRRVQLLLDCQPVFGRACYEALIFSILKFYAIRHAELSRWEWDGLISDLLRYYRSMDNSCRWHPQMDHAAWRERNLKLRFSRRANIFSLIGLLLMSSQRTDKPSWVVSQLSLTPLERILQFTEEGQRSQLVEAYAQFLQYIDLPEDEREAEFSILLDQSRLFAQILHDGLMRADAPWMDYARTLLVGS